MNKPIARTNQKNKILELENRAYKEKKICENLKKRISGCKKIIGYKSDKWEVNLDSVWDDSSLGVEFYFPKVTSTILKEMEFVLPTSWEVGVYGILEPVGETRIPPKEADLVIVPSLGFNSLGFRLGRGGGYYDRALRKVDFKKMIGIGFLELFSIDFTSTDYDIRVGELITETQVLFF